jgi:hypothetical protein
VVLWVNRPQQLYRRLGDRGARVLTPAHVGADRDDRFGVVDCGGTVLVFAAASGLVPALSRLPDMPLLRPVSAALDERRAAREEAVHLAAFRAFQDSLADRRDVFYMFFTGGLLHWAVKAASYVPAEVNLVFVGSALSAQEQAWLREHGGRPFHHISLRIDDQTMWEFLFASCDRNFGWLDIDCLVLNPELFAEMAAAVGPDDLLACTWWQSQDGGELLAGTPFVFLNADAVRAVQQAVPGSSPRAYRWIRASREVPGRRCYTLTPGRRLRRRLLSVLEPDDRGLPRAPGDAPYFDTMVVFQLVARTLGYRIRPVRQLARAGHEDGRSGGERGEEYSDELVHVGGISYGGPLTELSRLLHTPQTRQWLLIADYVALHSAQPRLPAAYEQRRRLLVEELAAGGIPTEEILPVLRHHLSNDRGLSDAAVEAALR